VEESASVDEVRLQPFSHGGDCGDLGIEDAPAACKELLGIERVSHARMIARRLAKPRSAAPNRLISRTRSGFLSSMNATEVQRLIEAGLPGARVQVMSDDDTHFEAVIVAEQFAGKRMIQRHQLVYATLGARMGREIHALSIQALTPDEAGASS